MADTPLSYDFLPWARRGLARAHAATQALGQPALPKVTVGLQISGSGGGAAAASAGASVPLKMFGPADVVGIDPRTIVRCEPRANASNVEPNYLAAVEFDPPDFPWLLTPARADARNRLAPWLVLLVFERDELQAPPSLRPGRVLPSLLLRDEVPVPLPDLADSWMWAHAQLVRNGASPDPATGLRQDPSRNLSRIVCPRRLRPGVHYTAALVPAFDAGLKAGLGQPVAPDAVLAPAWAGDEANGIELPLYFHWSFATGPAGDFETLARRLKCPAEYKGDAAIADKLAKLGRIATEVDADRLLQQGAVTPDVVRVDYMAQYQGALLSLSKGQPPPDPGRAEPIAIRLADILTAGDKRALGNLAQVNALPEVPLVGPPAYGVWHAQRRDLAPAKRKSHWLDGVNLSVPNRMAAGVGTRLVQANQEEFMQAAWAQAGEIINAERLLNRARLAQQALLRITQRVAKLPPVRQLQLLAPCAARLQPGALAPGHTLWALQRASSLPDRMFDGALRRRLSPVRPLLRSLAAREAAPGAAVQAGAAASRLVQTFASIKTAQPLVGAERFRADGFAGLKALDGLQLPDRPDARIPLPGFTQPLAVDQVKALLDQQAQVARVNKPGAWRSPPVTTKTRGGLLLDSHWQRLGQLASALSADQQLQAAPQANASALPLADMARSLVGGARSQPEGVLVTAERNAQGFALAPAQALMLDARNGNLAIGKAIRALHAPRGLEPAQRALALKPGQLAAVDVPAARLYGHAALFNALPPSVVVTPTAPTPGTGGVPPPVAAVPQLRAGIGGLFKPATPVRDLPPLASAPGARQSITLLPPERNAQVLARFRDAWRDKLAREEPAKPAPGLSNGLVAFDPAPAAQAAVAAIDVNQLVPARLASLIDLGGQQLKLQQSNLADLAGLTGVVSNKLLVSREQFVISALLDRVMGYPHLDEPLYQRLVAMDRSAFMPGVEDIPQDTVLLTATNPRFVESFLLGSNHEMNRELLWRGFPTDQRGTPFQKFWPYFDPSWTDIKPIHQWAQAQPIGSAGGAQAGNARLALVVRGELLRRYPNTNIYAVKKEPNDKAPAFDGQAPAPNGGPRETRHPIGGGLLPPDITFFLFDIDPNQAEQWWWVVEEPMSEPRFGFDDQEQPRAVPRLRRRGGQLQHAHKALAFNLQAPGNAGDTWLDVDWSELPGVGNGANQRAHLRLQDFTGVRLTDASLQLNGNAHAGQVARAMLQRPFRGYFAGARLKSD